MHETHRARIFQLSVRTAGDASGTDDDWSSSTVSHAVYVHAVRVTVHRREESAVDILRDASFSHVTADDIRGNGNG
jgi:hypothetical protein